MSEIRSFTGTLCKFITCSNHAFYEGVLYSVQFYHVTHVFQSVVYAPVYVFQRTGLVISEGKDEKGSVRQRPFYFEMEKSVSPQQRLNSLIREMMSDGFDAWLRPAEVSPRLSNFSAQMDASPDILSVAIEPFHRTLCGQCFNNCLHVASAIGGKVRYGWSWHQFANLFVVAEFHAVWQASDGQLIDVTPPLAPRTSTTFSHDPVRVPPDAHPHNPLKGAIPNRRFALIEREDVRECIAAEDANAALNHRAIEKEEKIAITEVLGTIERNVTARKVLLANCQA